jgi:hypothetical protein
VSIPIPAPMLASPGGRPFSDPYWLYEIKFDGLRKLDFQHRASRREVQRLIALQRETSRGVQLPG